MRKTTKQQARTDLMTSHGLLAAIEAEGGEVRIEPTPTGPELRVGNLAKLSPPVWTALTTARDEVMARLWLAISSREKAAVWAEIGRNQPPTEAVATQRATV